MCVPECVLWRAAYPSRHIVCSRGEFLWLCHMLHVSSRGWGQALCKILFKKKYIHIPEGAGYPACHSFTVVFNGLGNCCYRWGLGSTEILG